MHVYSHLFGMVSLLCCNNNVSALQDSLLDLNMNMNTENREQWQSVATSSSSIAAGLFPSYQATSHQPCSSCSIYVFHIFLFVYLQTGNDNWFITEDKGNICLRQTPVITYRLFNLKLKLRYIVSEGPGLTVTSRIFLHP